MALSAARSINTATSVAALREQVKAWRAEGLTVALVPTMGALHEGHMSLIRKARTEADKVVVSIFVNPRQFGPTEDFAQYPRQLDQDRFKVGMAGGHLVYAPGVEEMYPLGSATTVTVEGVSRGLCGDRRPGHFQGVATVVCKLLLQALPDVALFGEKDYQQLMVIRRMVADLDIPVRIVGVTTAREMDGLALSSRNAYLDDRQRSVANLMYKAMWATGQDITAGMEALTACARAEEAILAAGFDRVDYIELRDAETLAPITGVPERPARLLAAAFLGTTRLIDNIPVEPPAGKP